MLPPPLKQVADIIRPTAGLIEAAGRGNGNSWAAVGSHDSLNDRRVCRCASAAEATMH
jgi:hypothetical protein